MNNNKAIIIVVLAVAIIFFLYCMYGKKGKTQYYSKGTQPKQTKEEKSPSTPSPPIIENFTGLAAGANSNTGHFLDDQYDLLPGADNGVPAQHFADMVDHGNHLEMYQTQNKDEGEDLSPMQRLHRVQGKSLMPRVSTNVTPFNVDIANPTSHKYMVNTPRVSTALKSRYKDYSLSSFTRGDIPITHFPTIPLVSKTIQGRDDLRLDGLFTPYK